MKLQTKLSLVSGAILLLTVLTMLMVGTLIIDEIVYQFNRNYLQSKILEINRDLDENYQVLEQSGLANVKAYRDSVKTQLINNFRQMQIGKSGRLTIIDEKGRNIYNTCLVPKDETDKMFKQHMGFTKYEDTKRIPKFCVFLYNNNWGWLLVVSITRGEMLEKKIMYIRTTGILAVCVLTLTLFISMQFSSRVSHRISEILDSVKKVGKGDFSHKIDLTTDASDELKELQFGINSMIDDIQRREEEQRIADEELQKHQKLESIGILAGGIAHDFNNILTAILGNLQLAKSRATDVSLKRFLGDSEKATSRAMDLTRQLLTFAKGGLPIKKTISAAELTRSAASFVLSGTKSRAEFKFDTNLKPIDADPGQLSQVINNIVINANQSMPEGGLIEIAVRSVNIDAQTHLPLAPGEYVLISVSDHGAGIKEEDVNKVFDPFFTTKPNGTGLGLATAYSIVKKHDGHIAVNSHDAKGTTFDIYLPASKKKIETVKTEETLTFRDNRNILVMDDQEAIRNLFIKLLDESGCPCETVDNGEKALELYAKAKDAGAPFELVVLDLTVPGGMGGKATIEKLREIDPDVKAVVMSGYSHDPVMSNYRKYGFKERLVKPFTLQELSAVLQKVFKS